MPRSIADGALTQHLGQYTFAIIREKVTDVVTVPDQALVRAMSFFAERMNNRRADGVVPCRCRRIRVVPVADKRVGVILSGGNVIVARFAALVTG